ncbi:MULTISPECIES: NAD(P)H oxidoreductase [Streptomyces]|uniref:NADPH oxidoreductase n=2 Tax=Streptomyces TaxID=1883 RepID=A0A0W7X4R7_9ACTN|nr:MULTISPECIES: NAD(P)H oxidoreductase [Streptomyces]KUF17784.1 NADPH oxidoreductase [Streptomyces silvensis]MVO83586.1 NAD(P)H oxidoreductase [Streptomyces typhae]
MAARLKVLLVTGHPRSDSLTAQLARHARDRLTAAGHAVDLLDLEAEGFDPRMTPADEPDWDDPHKEYSPEVRAHMRRVADADVIVVVFPLWWFGLPALLKGWIDRVWNNGFAYGREDKLLVDKRMLWLGLVSYDEAQFAELGWEDVVTRVFRKGVSQFCGMRAERVVVRYVYEALSVGEGAFKVLDGALDEVTGSPA